MRRVAAWSLSLIAATMPAAAADQKWDFFRTSADVRLFYGVPESDLVTLNIICEPKPRRLYLASFVVPPKPRQGAKVQITLRNSGASLEYDATIGRDRTHEVFYAEARPRFDDALFRFLSTGSTLGIEVAGARETIPLRGIQGPLAATEGACLGKR